MSMRRRTLVVLGAAASMPRVVFAQAKKQPVVIGWLGANSLELGRLNVAGFKEGLAALDCKEGAQFLIEGRWTDGRLEKLPALAEELKQSKPGMKTIISSHLRERTMTLLRTPADKLVLPALLLVVGAFLILGAVSVWITWRDAKALMTSLQREKAENAAAKIHEYLAQVEKQLRPIGQVHGTEADRNQQWRFEYFRVTRRIPEITNIIRVNAEGQRVFGGRLRMYDESSSDHSDDVRFIEARKHGKYLGPMYLGGETKAFVSFAIADAEPNSGVTIVELNIVWLWNMIDAIKVGGTGYAYVVDGEGRLIASRDKDQVLRETYMFNRAALDVVRGRAPGEGMTFDTSPSGAAALSAYAVVPTLAWKVFVELPVAEARVPLWRAVMCVAGLMGLGLLAILLASLAAARARHSCQPPESRSVSPFLR